MKTHHGFCPRILIALALLLPSGCALFATRPVQEMSDTSAAIRAAREVQADTLAPELFREANEWWFKAKKEYKYKNFQLALEDASKARHLAEQSEFEAIRSGGTRTQVDAPPDPFARPDPGPPKYSPYAYPTPTGTPQEVYDIRKAEEEKAKTQTTGTPTSTTPGGTPNPVPNAQTPATGSAPAPSSNR